MAETYATLADLQARTPASEWATIDHEQAQLGLDTASALLRQTFRNFHLDLEARIAEGKVEEILLKDVVCTMVQRKLDVEGLPFGGEFSQISQSAGPYQTSFSLPSSMGNFYLKKSEMKMLGMPSVITRTLTFLR